MPQYSLLWLMDNKSTLYIPQLMHVKSCYPSTMTDCQSLTFVPLWNSYLKGSANIPKMR